MTRFVRRFVLVAALSLPVAWAAEPSATPATEGQLTPAVLKAVRAATYEVVLKKPEADPVKYERPLPLDQLPFSVRNDKYESIGTAFAIAPGRFVTAAHVTNVANGSLWGAPALRDAQGHVYPIDKVFRFSLDQDFIVFDASSAPSVTPLATSTSYEFDTPVHAVGNALGQGIIARDGTLTSETPEDQDGRWKWLRFSAPASPGNSGGPLLDAQGRVIGLISRKSANENLNFALPIARVLDAPDKATMDLRWTVSLPFLAQRKQMTWKSTFDLPLSFADFDRKYVEVANQDVENAQKKLLEESVADLFPRGKSGKPLADPYLGAQPGFVTQQSDGNWDVPRNNPGSNVTLGSDGYVWTNAQAGGAVFHVHYPSDLDVQKSRGNSQLLADQLLKSLPLTRTVGSEKVRVVSIGAAGKPEDVRDAEGRQWQLLRYHMLYSDSGMMVMALPAPDGYVGYLRFFGRGSEERIAVELKLMADFLQAPYVATLPRWRAFLAETRLLPAPFAQWHAALDPAGEVSLALPRVSITMNRNVLALSDRSTLAVYLGMIQDGDHFAWDTIAERFSIEPANSAAIAVIRRPRPPDDAAENVLRRWNNMKNLAGGYTGMPLRDPQMFYVAKVAGAEGVASGDAKFLYDVSYSTPTIRVPGEVPRAAPRLLEMVAVREK